MPVAVTTTVAVPRVTDVFWNAMFERSPNATSALGRVARVLRDGCALAGERGLLRLERRGAHDAAVGRDDVARLELHDVAGDEVDGGDERELAVPDDLGVRDLHLGEGVDAGAGLELLA